ncbi:MAG: hypothetical protein Q9214_004065 [Letrouitia sp. 1 TL-2023]
MANHSTMDSNHLLSEDPFQNQDTQRFFEAIDQLRSHGLNHDLDLPELVIVGDQSVGKSSLLQSLTDIPFPVAGRLCTRFPTRIVSRRTPNEIERTKISIERKKSLFSAFGAQQPEERYRAFTRSCPSVSATEFKDLINEAKSFMGISKGPWVCKDPWDTSSFGGDKNFSRDVLKVEISGPNRSYFSILDVPGVFQSATHDVTRDERDGVREMVASYMAPKQSVIICVADGTYEVANQAAFEMTKEHDPERKRTVGVVTKCDVTQDVTKVLELAQNEEIPLLCGWFFVRNRTPKELEIGLGSQERHQIEQKFFSQEPWNRLPKDHCGTQALKKYLAHLLCERIQEAFPIMLSTIEARQRSEQIRLDECGNARQTLEQKRTYLTSIAQKFHSLAEKVLWGRYDSISSNAVKLRRQIREVNDSFSSEMILNGHCVAFVDLFDSENHKLTDRDNAASSTSSKPRADDPSQYFSKPPPIGFSIPPTAPSWQPLIQKDGTLGPSDFVEFQNICCLHPWASYSFEELRLRDKIQNSQPLLNVEQSSTGGLSGSTFNSSSHSATQSSSSTSLFGKPTAKTATQSTSPGPLFGSGTKIGAEGTTRPSPSNGNGLFSTNQSSSSDDRLFGAKTSPNATSTPQPFFSSGLFNTNQPSSSSGGLFSAHSGLKATTQPSSGSGLFNTNQSNSSSGGSSGVKPGLNATSTTLATQPSSGGLFSTQSGLNASTQPSSASGLFSTDQSTSSSSNFPSVKPGLNVTSTTLATQPPSSGDTIFGVKSGPNATSTSQSSSGSGSLFDTKTGLTTSGTTHPSIVGSIFDSTQKKDSNNLNQPSNSIEFGTPSPLRSNNLTRPSSGGRVFGSAQKTEWNNLSHPSSSGVFGAASPLKSDDMIKPSSDEYSNAQPSKSLLLPSNAERTQGSLFGGQQQAKEVANGRLSEIYTLIREVITDCRGTELQGTLNPDVLPTLFHNQIRKWQGIAEQHFRNVTAMTLSTLLLLVDMSCKEIKTREKINHTLRRANETATKRGMAQIAQRINDLSAGHLQTQNQIFEQKLRKARLLRFESALKRYQASQKPKNDGIGFGGGGGFGKKLATDREVVIDMWDIPSLFDELHMSNAQNLEDEIHDTLQAYYELARNDFVEYVTQLVVEPYLKDPQGPVLCFSPVSVGSLSDEELEDFAAEDEKLVRERAQAEETLVRLKKAEEIAVKYI